MLISMERCIGCGLCTEDCLRDLLEVRDGKAYFDTQGSCMDCGHCVAICPTGAISAPDWTAENYAPAAFDVSPDNLLNLMRFRRSIRKYTAQKLTEEEIAQLLSAAQSAPSGSNRRALRYVVITEQNKEITEKALKTLYDAALHMEEIESLRTILNYKQKWLQFYEDYQSTGRDGLFFNAPCVILAIAGDEQNSTLLDCGLAAANMELMAHAMGLGSCYVGFFSRAVGLDASLGDLIGLQAGERLVATLAVGHPDVKYRRTVVRSRERVDRL